MKPVTIKGNHHFIEEVPLYHILDEFETPLIVYSKKQITENSKEFLKAFSIFDDHEAHYASKANYNPNILKLLKSNGFGLDAANVNEASLGIKVGFDKSMITVSPNNQTSSELNWLVREGFMINFDDEIQFSQVEETLDFFSIRVNPGIGKGEFKGIVTGGKNSKFGTSPERALKAYERAKELGIRRFGIHMHTGSNVLDSSFYKESSIAFFKIANKISSSLGIHFEYLDIGGGYGVPYQPNIPELDIEKVAKIFHSNLKEKEFENLHESKIITEPGRYIVANSAVALSSVTNVKRTDRDFLGTNLSFNVLIRPALYGAKHYFEILDKFNGANKRYIITGQACENTDRLGYNIPLIDPKIGDVLITYNTGAYVMSMASNYNLLYRPAEILVDGDKISLIRKKDDLANILDSYSI